MKTKNILIFMVTAFVIQSSLFAANAVIKNSSLKDQDVTIFAAGAQLQSFTLNKGEKRSVYTGSKGFSRLTWKAPLNGGPQYAEGYSADIPSSATLKNGLIMLNTNGGCSIDFDANSSNGSGQVRSIQTKRINK